MKPHTLYQVFVCACTLLSLSIPQRSVYAQAPGFAEIPLESLHEEKPIELVGLVSSQTLDVPIPASWIVGEENWLEIQFRVSPLLDAARSSVTVALNDFQLISYSLDELPATKQQIRIPADMFRQGSNTLTFTGTLYLPEDAQTNCQNWDDPSRWLAIDPGGLLHISFGKHDPQMDLATFPQPFLEPMQEYVAGLDRPQPLIVLPEGSTQDDLTSLSTLSYLLGSYASLGYTWHPKVVKASEWNTSAAANRNLIFLGEPPAELQDRASQDKDYIGLFASPWSAGNAVMVIGDHDRRDSFTPASVFGDRARRILLQGNLAYIDKASPAAPQSFQNSFSFEDLGYLDRTVRGLGQQNIIYRFHLPYDVEPVLVKLNLGLVHSPELDTQNSTFTVFLNGFSIAGIRPTDRSSTGELITIGLPAKKFRRGINFIRVQFDMHVPYSSCERGLESVWATVLNNSTLETTYRNHTPIPSLEDFPLPFSDSSGTTFVIPDQYSQEDLGYISQLSYLLGASAYRADYPPQVMTAADFKQRQTKPSNVITVGLPSENSLTRSVNDLLPQPFQVSGNSLEEGYGVYLPTSNKEASLGLMQIIPSPWTKGGTVLVLTGNDHQGLNWVWDVILNPALQDQFSGNLMVVGSDQRSQTLGPASVQGSPQALFQQIADASNIPIIGSLLQKSGQAFLLPSLIAVGSALIFVIGILWLVRAVNRRRAPSAQHQANEGDQNG